MKIAFVVLQLLFCFVLLFCTVPIRDVIERWGIL